ncbi:type 1 glutamine amidotransferase [Streptomyces sp. JJ36]|nr:type 1 glutamine amidotransferase [Streptomyces sp. JJ36]
MVVQNGPDGGPGRFGARLAEEGLSPEVWHAYDAPHGPPPGRAHRALVVLGGGHLPDGDEGAPWLPRTRELVRDALDRQAPVFGICLGGQLLAHVAGGTVRGEHGPPEVGSTGLTLRAEAAEDPLFHGLPERVTAIENHVDAITALPPGAVWLAESAGCPHQAFRLGGSAWGVQFHPEATEAQVARWPAERLRRLGFDPAEVRDRTRREAPVAAPVWDTVARRFAAVVHAA